MEELDIIANEFELTGTLKKAFVYVVLIVRRRQEKLRRIGYTEQQLNTMYLTPYELAEQIYTKKPRLLATNRILNIIQISRT